MLMVHMERLRRMKRYKRRGRGRICASIACTTVTYSNSSRDHATARSCSFCDRKSRAIAISTSADEVVAYIEERLGQEYQDAANEVAYESREGGYQADIMTSLDVLWEVEFDADERAFDYVAQNLPDYAWVEQDFYSLHPFQTLKHGWDEFSTTVKHRTRYLFFDPLEDDVHPQHDEIRPEYMLAALGRVIEASGLVRIIPAGSRVYRVRQHDASTAPTTMAELGPPPREHAIHSNRMSPAGISMMYAAEDEATAIRDNSAAGSQRPLYGRRVPAAG